MFLTRYHPLQSLFFLMLTAKVPQQDGSPAGHSANWLDNIPLLATFLSASSFPTPMDVSWDHLPRYFLCTHLHVSRSCFRRTQTKTSPLIGWYPNFQPCGGSSNNTGWWASLESPVGHSWALQGGFQVEWPALTRRSKSQYRTAWDGW